MQNLKKSLLTIGLLTGLGWAANAQTITANANATSSATVLTDISVTKDSDIAFGNVLAGTTPTLDAQTFANSTDQGATATLGKFTVTGTPTANVLVTFSTLVTMSNGDATDNLDFTPSVFRTALTDATDGETTITSGGTYLINSSNSDSVSGTDYFFVGGTLEEVGGGNIPSDAAGLYTGTFTLTVAYN